MINVDNPIFLSILCIFLIVNMIFLVQDWIDDYKREKELEETTNQTKEFIHDSLGYQNGLNKSAQGQSSFTNALNTRGQSQDAYTQQQNITNRFNQNQGK